MYILKNENKSKWKMYFFLQFLFLYNNYKFKDLIISESYMY